MKNNFMETLEELDNIYTESSILTEVIHIGNDNVVWRAVRDGIIDGADTCGIKLTKQQWEAIADAVVDSLHSKMDSDPTNKWNKANGRK